MPSHFIVLEGPDGAGTTTHSNLLQLALEQKGVKVLRTCEPTNGPIGRVIREQLSESDISSGEAIQLLFCADRAWHLNHEILPALEAGLTVICDRYIPSTLVYGQALGLDIGWLKDVNKIFRKADKTILLLPPFEVSTQRLKSRDSTDAFEDLEFQREVYDLYKKAADQGMFDAIIDTSGDKQQVANEIFKAATN